MPIIRRQRCYPPTHKFAYEVMRDSSGKKLDTIIECDAEQAQQEFDARVQQGFKQFKSYTGTDILIRTDPEISFWVFIFKD